MPSEPIPLEEIRAAALRIHDTALRTPLVRLGIEEREREIYLKLENLQRTGSFKLRGAANRLLTLSREERERGLVTASTGNLNCCFATSKPTSHQDLAVRSCRLSRSQYSAPGRAEGSV